MPLDDPNINLDEITHLIRWVADTWRVLSPLRRWRAVRKGTPAPLTTDDLAEIYAGLNRRRVKRFEGGHATEHQLLTGIQANAFLRERGWVGRTVDLSAATLIDTSSLGRWSSMALAYVREPDPRDTNGSITLRFRCFSRRRAAYDFLKAADWKSEIRVRGEIVKCSSLGGDPITLTNCDFE